MSATSRRTPSWRTSCSSDKWEKLTVFDRHGTQFKLTDTRWQRFVRLLAQYEGWSSTLRAVHGHEMVQFLEESARYWVSR